jgi:hypothetical protein
MPLPETIDTTSEGQIIGGIFAHNSNANQAIEAFSDFGIPPGNVQRVIKPAEPQAEDAYITLLVGRGFAESQAIYYDGAIREGKILVVVYGVTDAASIIEIFSECKAEFNPHAPRDVRTGVTAPKI